MFNGTFGTKGDGVRSPVMIVYDYGRVFGHGRDLRIVAIEGSEFLE